MFVRVKVCVNMGCDWTHKNFLFFFFIFSLSGNCERTLTRVVTLKWWDPVTHSSQFTSFLLATALLPSHSVEHHGYFDPITSVTLVNLKVIYERWWISVPFYTVEGSHCVFTLVDLTQYSNGLSLVRSVPLSTAVNFLQGRLHCCWNSRAGVMVTFTNTIMNSDRRYCHPGISCIPN